MTLIQCSGCGQTVSSVASKCPKCGVQLSQYRFIQGQGGTLTECRRCARKVLSESQTCPYCGVARPGRRTPYAAALLVAALAVPMLVFAALRGRSPELPRGASAQPPAGREHRAAATPARPTALTSATQPAPSTPAPVPAAAPAATGTSTSAEARDTVVVEKAVPVTLTRWILDWANVREGRGLDQPVVRVLSPGMQIQVNDRQEGWWAVYMDSQVIGYVAGSLLGDQPPDSVVSHTVIP